MRPGVSRLLKLCVLCKFYARFSQDAQVTETLYVTRPLVLFYISTKYHQNIPKGIQVTEQTRSFTPTPTESPKNMSPAPLVVGS